jgi:hypothetical protein
VFELPDIRRLGLDPERLLRHQRARPDRCGLDVLPAETFLWNEKPIGQIHRCKAILRSAHPMVSHAYPPG